MVGLLHVFFFQRVQLFREFVSKDKEVLGITRPYDDFVPQGTLITIHRNRLLEVSYRCTESRSEAQCSR